MSVNPSESFDFEITPKEMSKRLRKLYPNIREGERDCTVSLPRKFDMGQASAYLEVHSSGFTASFKSYVNVSTSKDVSGVVRSDKHIPASVGFYYFEVRILNGERGSMGVGLSKRGGDLNRMPGWDSGCFGYHGDDGNFFSASGTGTKYGPKFGTGDVIGCGIDTLLYQVFFTKNGRHLGVAYQGTGPFERLYPTVGLKTPGEQLEINFGQLPFYFDFENYRENLNQQKAHLIESVKMPEDIGKHMDRAVISFLGRVGALETLKVFETVSKAEGGIDHDFLKKRKEIVDMVENAAFAYDIQERLERYFPGCIQDDIVHLSLLCLRYIDLANTLKSPPASFKPVLSDSNDAKHASRNSQRKSTKRTSGHRHADNTSPIVFSPPAIRRPSTCQPAARKQYDDMLMANPKIKKIFLDKDTNEEMVMIDGITLTKQMYIEMYASGELEKVGYLLKMGREIANRAKAMDLEEKDRLLIETAMVQVRSGINLPLHPYSHDVRRYIANMILIMINKWQSKKNNLPENTDKNVYSELRGMFLAWNGAHCTACAKDHPSAAINFMRQVVIDQMSMDEIPILYSDEPMEIDNGEKAPEKGPNDDEPMVVEEEDGQDV